MMRERKKAAFLLTVNYTPVRLPVQLNWRLGDASAVPAGSARTMEAHIADQALGSAQIELAIFHLLFSITKRVQGF